MVTSIYKALNDEPHWYALHTRARHEKKIDFRLKEKGITSYLPLCVGYHRWSDRYKQVEEPLFSCYLFVHIPLRERIHSLQTDGVVNLVSFNGIPAWIPDHQIEALRYILKEKRHLNRIDFFTRGQKVRITQGILKGLEGTVICVKGQCRFILAIESIRQAIAVEVDGAELEPICAA